MSLITRGLGIAQQLITQGFGYVIEIITPDGPIVRTGSGYGGGFLADYKEAIDLAIRTSAIRKFDTSFKIKVNVTFAEQPPLKVIAKLKKITSKNKDIELKITIL